MARGHIKKGTGNSWYLVIPQGRDPNTGKRKQKWVTFHGTEAQAKRRLNEIIVDDSRDLSSGAVDQKVNY